MPSQTRNLSKLPVDTRARASVSAMWVSSLLMLFGLETRSFVYRDRFTIPLVAIAFFVCAVYLLHWINSWCRTTFERAIVNRRLRWLRFESANTKLEEFVAAIAEELGIQRVEVRAIPLTGGDIVARAETLGCRRVMVISMAAQQLFFNDPEKFRLLVLHELGHFVNRDASTLSLARAISIVTVGLTLLKLAFVFTQGGRLRDQVVTMVDLFPRTVSIDDSTLMGPSTPFAHYSPASNESVIAFYVLYCVFMSSLLLLLYVATVRRREFAADQIVGAALESSAAQSQFASLVRSQRRNGFGLWHPSPDARAHAIVHSSLGPSQLSRLESLLFVITVLSIRFVFGNTGLLRDGAPIPNSLIWLSLLFIFFIARTAVLILPITQSTTCQQLVADCARICRVGCYISGALVAYQYLYSGNWANTTHISVARLAELEYWDRVYLLLSTPIVLGAFCVGRTCLGIAWYKLPGSWPRRRFSSLLAQRLSAIATMVVGYLLLAIASPILSGLIDAQRDGAMRDYLNHRHDDVKLHESFGGFAPEGSVFPELTQMYPLEQRIRDARLMGDLERVVVRERFFSQRWNPPLSFIHLWEGPFRGGLFSGSM